MLKERVTYERGTFDIIWHDSTDFSSLDDIRQAYGILFDEQGKIIIVRVTPDGRWSLPGGTVEPGEYYEETLVREIMEEADVLVENITPIGYQEIIDIKEGKSIPSHYQLRYVATIKEVLPQTIDPGHGTIPERLFIKPSEFLTYCPWGITGEHMMKKAVEWFNSIK